MSGLSDVDLDNIEAHQRDPLAARVRPETVLALVGEVRRLRAGIRELADSLDRYVEAGDGTDPPHDRVAAYASLRLVALLADQEDR